MFGPLGAGPLVSPWMGVWDLAWQSSTTAAALLAIVLTLVMAGLLMSAYDGEHR